MPGYVHTSPSARTLRWGIWVNIVRSWAGFEVCCFCGYPHYTTGLNSSSNILFLDWGLVCQRVCSLSLGLPFAQHFRKGRPPAVFYCYVLQEVGRRLRKHLCPIVLIKPHSEAILSLDLSIWLSWFSCLIPAIVLGPKYSPAPYSDTKVSVVPQGD